MLTLEESARLYPLESSGSMVWLAAAKITAHVFLVKMVSGKTLARVQRVNVPPAALRVILSAPPTALASVLVVPHPTKRACVRARLSLAPIDVSRTAAPASMRLMLLKVASLFSAPRISVTPAATSRSVLAVRVMSVNVTVFSLTEPDFVCIISAVIAACVQSVGTTGRQGHLETIESERVVGRELEYNYNDTKASEMVNSDTGYAHPQPILVYSEY